MQGIAALVLTCAISHTCNAVVYNINISRDVISYATDERSWHEGPTQIYTNVDLSGVCEILADNIENGGEIEIREFLENVEKNPLYAELEDVGAKTNLIKSISVQLPGALQTHYYTIEGFKCVPRTSKVQSIQITFVKAVKNTK